MFLGLDLVPMLIGLLAALTCAIPGNFLALRRQALMGDAISHVVLPGIVIGFIVSGKVTTWVMLLGAGFAAMLAAGLIEVITRWGKVEPGAAMAITFTAMFAFGVLLLEQTDSSAVHLDVEHALFGNLESLIWPEALGVGWNALADSDARAGLPPELGRMFLTLITVTAGVLLFWRPLVHASFDPEFARVQGLPTGLVWLGLVVLAALAAVAAFSAVGAIIAIAMFVCPVAAARLMTDRLGAQLGWSVVFATIAAISGFAVAGTLPRLIGLNHAVSAAGAIACIAGLILAGTALFGPCRQPYGAAASGSGWRRRPPPAPEGAAVRRGPSGDQSKLR